MKRHGAPPSIYEQRATNAAANVDAVLRCCRDWPTNAAYTYSIGRGVCGLCRTTPELVYPLERP